MKGFDIPYGDFKTTFSDHLSTKIVVVSVFGKSSLLNTSYKQSVVSDLFNYQASLCSEHLKLDEEVLCNIEGFFSDEEKTLYLNLRGGFDTATLISFLKKFRKESQSEGFLSVWSRLKHHYARALLFLFSVSHILVLVDPSYCLDMNSINLLKALSAVREDYQTKVGSVLKEVESDWTKWGRPCTPRLLFLFLRCPEEMNSKEIDKMERSLEDQIYWALKRSDLVKNNCEKAFFSIAPNEKFVFARRMEDATDDYTSSLVSLLLRESHIDDESSIDRECEAHTDLLLSEEPIKEEPVVCFKEFLIEHINRALTEGFNDHMGKYIRKKAHFMLPSLEEFFVCINSMLEDTQLGFKAPPSGPTLNLYRFLLPRTPPRKRFPPPKKHLPQNSNADTFAEDFHICQHCGYLCNRSKSPTCSVSKKSCKISRPFRP